MKNYLFFVFYILSNSLALGQEKPLHFLDIPTAQLEMTSYPADTTAAAVILHDYGSISVKKGEESTEQVYTHSRRIKILKKGGLSQGDIEIPYYSYDDIERINNVIAAVTSPTGKIYNITEEEFFTEKKNQYWSSKKIALPQLEVGSIIDYRYEIRSKRIVELREWYFQTDIPIVFSQLSVSLLSSYTYMYLFQGFAGIDRVKKEGNAILNNSISEEIIGYKTFEANNIPALKEEPFITTLDDYRLRIRFQCKYHTSYYGKVTPILAEWNTVTEQVLESSYFEAQYKKGINCGKILRAAAPILKQELDPLEKAKAFYDFINNNVEVNQKSGIYVENSLNEAFEKKSGSKSELNLMLLALLRKAKIEAYPVLISTRDNGYPIQEHPIVDQFNRTILLVIIDEKEYFVEQGNKFRPFGQLSRNSMNRSGYRLRRPIGKWLDITPNKSKKIIISEFNLDDEGNLKGEISANYTNIEAADNREYWKTEEEEKTWEEELENTIVDFELESVTIENEKKLEKPFKVHFKGDFSGAVLDIGDFVYINPFIFADFSENPFKSEKRQYPVDFPHPFSNQFIINIKYDTEDYYVEELPKDTKLELLGKTVTVRYATQEKEPGWIQITYALSVNNPYFPVDTYENLRSLFDITAEKLREQIVLKKL